MGDFLNLWSLTGIGVEIGVQFGDFSDKVAENCHVETCMDKHAHLAQMPSNSYDKCLQIVMANAFK